MDYLTNETLEIDEINRKIVELQLSVDNTKKEFVKYTDNVYIKYSSSGRPKKNRQLYKTAKTCQEELNNLRKDIEEFNTANLNRAEESITENLRELNTINFTLKVLSNVRRINEKLDEFDSLLTENRFLTCRQTIKALENLIQQIPDEENLLVSNEFRAIVNERNTLLSNKIRWSFQEHVITCKTDETSTIRINTNVQSLQEVLSAMFYEESDTFSVTSFAKFLWINFFTIIVDNSTEVNRKEIDTFAELSIKIIDANKRPKYTEVFQNIHQVLQYLIEYFNSTSIEYIGGIIRDNLSELIIKNCLSYTIPSTVEELRHYNKVIEDVKELERVLKESKFFANDTSSLLDYASNIDFHFINKKCQRYLHECTIIMKKDLHDMLPVEIQSERCCISKSVIELMEYCERILVEASQGSCISAGRLFTTCRNIVNKYATFVPDYHARLLKTIPQQVALFHNNCSYITHKLREWNDSYIKKLPSTLDVSSIGFLSEIDTLERTGSSMFNEYVANQSKQLVDIMKDNGLDGVVLEGNLSPKAEKSVRQCLRQQELLKTVWYKVLDNKIYNETIGSLLNVLCARLIESAVNFEDISSKAAEQLQELIEMAVNRGGKLFGDVAGEPVVYEHVPLWGKLKELGFVLGAGLKDIDDRWADRKGPLGVHFEPVELKGLVRALFQNTDRRAALLAKIQE
ncbi:unnamed protein product [Phyllotreta striolata]|uniref:Centromere/kinetochore protein zw10 n=1 Tax=Phyllotreta striolata TaxID=444603 RepID=A0A9N9TGC6_PHYSR|nr:unnamed protein product [Phyllotreta striolata]